MNPTRIAELSRAARKGDLGTVRTLLSRTPGLAKARTETGWGPVFACAAEPVKGNARKATRLARVMEELLHAGADPNATLPPSRWSLPVLFFAAGQAGNVPLTRVLLRAGAKPNDGESLYHSVERRLWDCAELLLKHGGKLNYVHPVYLNTPLYFIARTMGAVRLRANGREIFSWLFRHGARPDIVCGKERATALHAAAERGWPRDLIELLIAHGADPRKKDGKGRTLSALARLAGRPRLATWLAAKEGAR